MTGRPAARARGIALAVCVLASAGAGTGGVAVAQDQAAPSAAPRPAPLPAPAAGGPSQAEQDASVVAFTTQVRQLTLVRDSAAYVAPSLDAPQMYPLRGGTGLVATATSGDGAWVVSITEDGQAAFIPAADLGPYDPGAAPRAPEPPAVVAGLADVVDTATLTVDGRRVPLAGVVGVGGSYPAQLQALLAAQGRAVRCTPAGEAYVCKLPDGLDIARAALFNGAASVGPDAGADYRQQADAAKAARRGIWR